MFKMTDGPGSWDPKWGRQKKKVVAPPVRSVTPTKPKKPVSATPKGGGTATAVGASAGSKGSTATKEYIARELTTLTGDANIDPTVNVKSLTTIRVNGVGAILNGAYFVESVTHTFSKDSGHTKTASLIRNATGDYIKKGHVVSLKSTVPKVATRNTSKVAVTPTVKLRKYKIVSGDTLSRISLKFYGKSNLYAKIATANNMKTTDILTIGKSLIIP